MFELDRRQGNLVQLIGYASKANEIIKWVPQYQSEEIIETAWMWHQKKFGGEV